jgi:hypothetical protein
MSPEGLDVRLSLDLYLQYRTDQLMIDHRGAAILLNAASGEIFVMSSHPTFDPNELNETGPKLNEDPNKPLINRATQGLYPIGSLIDPFVDAIYDDQTLDDNDLRSVFEALGFYRAPQLRMQVAEPLRDAKVKDLHVSPLQVALAAAALSNHGIAPVPRIATAVNTPEEGWIVLPALGTSLPAIQTSAADETAESLMVDGENYWAHTGSAEGDESTVTWFIAGTPPNWQATPMVVVVLLEEDNARLAEWIGREVLVDAMNP